MAPRLGGAFFSVGATMGRESWTDARWDSEFKWMGRGGLDLRLVIFTAASPGVWLLFLGPRPLVPGAGAAGAAGAAAACGCGCGCG